MDLPSLPAFTIDILIDSLLKPSRHVSLRVTVVGNTTLKRARLTILLQGVAGSDSVGIALGQKPTPQWELDRSFSPNAKNVVTRALVFPGDGLYHLIVLAKAMDLEATETGPIALQDVVYKELWLVVDSAGGSVHNQLTLADFRKSLRPVRRPGANPAGPQAVASVADCDTWQVLWLNDITMQYEPVAGVPAWGNVVEDQTGNPIASWWAATDASGSMTICAGGGGTSYTGEVYLQDVDVTVSPHSGAYVVGSSTGGFFQTTVTTGAGRIWRNFHTLIPRSRTLLGRSRAAISVVMQNQCPIGAFACFKTPGFLNPGDYIAIPPGNELGSFATFSQGHEYGHAVHYGALGGLPGNNCSGEDGHRHDQATFFSCALREGFAHFHGSVVFGPELLAEGYYSDYQLEANQSYPGYVYVNNQRTGTVVPDGSIVEGAVAAFLYDLYDGPTAPDSPTGGTDNDDDAVEYGGPYIAAIVSTCLANGTRATGIDHLVYCFERWIDPVITSSLNYFPTRSPDPSSFSENATEPPTWNVSAIRSLWVRDLYGNAPLQSGPGGPAPTVTITGPSSAKPSSTCLWTANASGGTPPYAYAWSVYSASVGGNSSELIYQNSGSSFTINVTVTYAGSPTGSASKGVTVTSSAPLCQF